MTEFIFLFFLIILIFQFTLVLALKQTMLVDISMLVEKFYLILKIYSYALKKSVRNVLYITILDNKKTISTIKCIINFWNWRKIKRKKF